MAGRGNGYSSTSTSNIRLTEAEAAPWWMRWVAPWVVLPALLLAGVFAHLGWGDDPALPWLTALLTPVVLGLAWMSWTVARTRRVGPVGRAHVAFTVGAGGLWLLLALVLGPWSASSRDLFAVFGPALAASWNIRTALHRPAVEGESEPATPRAAGRRFLATLGLAGEELHAEEINEHRIGGRLALASGNHTTSDAQKKAEQMAVALGVPKSGVRFTENPDNASDAEFSFALHDVLGSAIPWPGPIHVDGSPFDAIPMGVDEIGRDRVKTIADKTGAKHELIQGMSGSGKSSGTRVEFCSLMTRRETAIIVIDTAKGTQAFGPAAPGLALFLTDHAKAATFLRRLRAVIKARTSYLGARGLDSWAPGCGLTFLLIQIEEASDLFAEVGDAEVEGAVKAARSAGITVKVSLQRPSYDQVSTTLRSQLGGITCFGMAEDDPVCMLPDGVVKAGAEPAKFRDKMPGCCYMSGVGISLGEAATPMRTYEITAEQFRLHAEAWGPRMDPIDQVTTRALGDLWTKRERPVDLVARLNAEALRAAGMPAQVDGQVLAGSFPRAQQDDVQIERDNDHDEDDLGDDGPVFTLTPEDMGVTTDDDDPDDGATMYDELDGLDVDITFRAPVAEVSVEAARAQVADRLEEFERAGRDTITVPDLADLVASGARSRGWYRKELLRLCRVGRLEDEGGGAFRIVADVLDDLDDDGDQDGQGDKDEAA